MRVEVHAYLFPVQRTVANYPMYWLVGLCVFPILIDFSGQILELYTANCNPDLWRRSYITVRGSEDRWISAQSYPWFIVCILAESF